ncbi:MAG: sigma 54-interacting transcriptional regulator [Planctomycetota bacterium]
MNIHSIVNALIHDIPLWEVIREFQGDDAHVHALMKSSDVLTGKISREEGLRIFESAASQKGDPDMTLIFYIQWIQVFRRLGMREQWDAAVRKAASLVTPRSPPALRSPVLVAQFTHALNTHGDLPRFTREMKDILKQCRKGSRPHLRALSDFATILADAGEESENDAWISKVSGNTPVYRQEIALARFTQCVETGRAAEACRLLPKLLPYIRSSRQPSFYHDILAGLSFMCLCLGHPPPPVPDSIETRPAWFRVNEFLLAREPGKALALCRENMNDPALHDRYVFDYGFDACTLLRTELACGNIEAARQNLARRWANGRRQYMDDVFLARIWLLRGNLPAAVPHFAAALRACERYGAKGRLEAEMRLACEINASDAMRLALEAEALLRGRKKTPAPPAPPMPSPPGRGTGRLVGTSAAIAGVREAIRRFAALDIPVLLTGETGTGKELAARALHEESPRAAEPFIAVNCGAITESLLEDELFGHEQGAFTGAEKARKGFFEEAGKGTVFLDEIGEIPARLQVALLRVLESAEVRPVGGSRSRGIACRVVAATNADLDALAEKETFRKDLLFRLRRLEIHISPLRERREDILSLADHFLSAERADGGRPALSEELKETLWSRDWPGNARELRNLIERMRLFHSEKMDYRLEDLAVADSPAVGIGGSPPGAAPHLAPPKAPPPPMVTTEEEILRAGRSPFRRHERLRALFRRHGRLTRLEICALLYTSKMTATRDLAELIREGFAERVTPTRSPRTHYFRLKTQDRGSGLVDRDSRKTPEMPEA